MRSLPARLSHQLTAATAIKSDLPTLFLSFDLVVTRHAIVRKSANKYRHIHLLRRLATKPGEITGLVLVLLALSLPSIASGESFEARLQQGFATLQGGDSEAALAAFLDLQVEQPDSPKGKYGIASARYVEALAALASGDDGAKGPEKMLDARAQFESMDTAADSAMSGLASFGAANSTAQIARHSKPMANYE